MNTIRNFRPLTALQIPELTLILHPIITRYLVANIRSQCRVAIVDIKGYCKKKITLFLVYILYR
jgi:hypothetical protein